MPGRLFDPRSGAGRPGGCAATALALVAAIAGLPAQVQAQQTFGFEIERPEDAGRPGEREAPKLRSGSFLNQGSLLEEGLSVNTDPAEARRLFDGIAESEIARLFDEDLERRRQAGLPRDRETTAYLPDGRVVKWRPADMIDRAAFEGVVAGSSLLDADRAAIAERLAGPGPITPKSLAAAAAGLRREGREDAADLLAGLFADPPRARVVGRAVGGPVAPLVREPGVAPAIDTLLLDTGEAIVMHSVGGEEVPGLFARETGEICGSDGPAPEGHCALPSVMLAHGGSAICSGVTIGDRHVLTAAHCVCEHDLWEAYGIKPAEIEIILGTDLSGQVMPVDSTGPVSIYPGYLDGACGSFSQSERRGDVAIVHLAQGALEAAMDAVETELADASDNGGFLVAEIAEAGKLKAPIGIMSDLDWEGLHGESFTFYGFGTGPEMEWGRKRAASITLSSLLPCKPEYLGDCNGPPVQEVVFDDEDVGLCAGDSGGGIFRATPESPPGFDRWAVVGILSGGPDDIHCHDRTTGTLLTDQHARYVVRLDTPRVADWIADIVGDSLATVPTEDAEIVFSR